MSSFKIGDIGYDNDINLFHGTLQSLAKMANKFVVSRGLGKKNGPRPVQCFSLISDSDYSEDVDKFKIVLWFCVRAYWFLILILIGNSRRIWLSLNSWTYQN